MEIKDMKEAEEFHLQLIQETEALRTGHFVLTSGKHSGRYVNKDDISTKPKILDSLADWIVEFVWSESLKVGVVAAPAVGAIAFGNRVAEQLGREVVSVFAEAEGDKFVFRRGYERFIHPGVKVLVVEDIITTGKTTRAMIEAVEALGGEVVGIGLIWNRSTEEFFVPVFACVSQTFPTYDPSECPLCQEKVPIDTQVNKHGREFLDQYGEDSDNWPANK